MEFQMKSKSSGYNLIVRSSHNRALLLNHQELHLNTNEQTGYQSNAIPPWSFQRGVGLARAFPKGDASFLHPFHCENDGRISLIHVK